MQQAVQRKIIIDDELKKQIDEYYKLYGLKNLIKEDAIMMEKIYNTMKSVGVWNLVLGILLICLGLVTGIFLIVNGENC